MGFNDDIDWVLAVGGIVIVIVGVCLTVYYMTFGVFYNADGFILTTFGNRSKTYSYRDIQTQQLYNNQGYTLIELHLADGNVVHLQSSMTGAYPFLDYAFEAWCRQTGRKRDECSFYDPNNSCWFPPVEG